MAAASTPPPRTPTPRARRPPGFLVGALCLVVTGVVVALAVAVDDARPTPDEVAVTAGGDRERAGREALRVLRQWDAARARAWARGDLRALRRLYVTGSAAGRRDVAMLRRWRDRGLRVDGMRTQVRSADVVRHETRRMVLVVTDRLTGAVAAGLGQRTALPADGFTTRRITLRRVAGWWRVAAVVPAGSGAG